MDQRAITLLVGNVSFITLKLSKERLYQEILQQPPSVLIVVNIQKQIGYSFAKYQFDFPQRNGEENERRGIFGVS